MKTQVTFSDFCDSWAAYDRADSFTYEGKCALFEYLESLEDECGIELELDIVGLDCDYCEYESAVEAATVYSFDPSDYDNEEDREDAARDYLQDNTTLIEFDCGVIIRQF